LGLRQHALDRDEQVLAFLARDPAVGEEVRDDLGEPADRRHIGCGLGVQFEPTLQRVDLAEAQLAVGAVLDEQRKEVGTGLLLELALRERDSSAFHSALCLERGVPWLHGSLSHLRVREHLEAAPGRLRSWQQGNLPPVWNRADIDWRQRGYTCRRAHRSRRNA